MTRTYCTLLLAGLAACASTATSPVSSWTKPTFSGSLPTAAVEPEDGLAPNDTTLPIGVGITTGPSTFLVGGTLDFPLDKNLTVGPSLQYGFDDDVELVSLTGQLKYFLSIGDDKEPSFLPYATGGIGTATIDKDGRSRDSGIALNVGAGLRLLTGSHYRLGSEVRLNWLPDELGGEHSYLSWEMLQVVVEF